MILRQFHAGLLLTALSACGALGLGSGLSDEDQTDLGQQALVLRQQSGVCSEYFGYTDPKIVDQSITQDTGKITIEFQLTPLQGFSTGSLVDGCFSQPPGGWIIGKQYSWQANYTIERWQSGWRIGQQTQ